MHVELSAHPSTYSASGARSYITCTNIEITGPGKELPNCIASFPGAYAVNDLGIVLHIYGTRRVPYNVEA